MSANPEKLLTVADVCEILNMSSAFVYAASARGELPAIRVGRCLRFRKEDIERYCEEHMITPPEPAA